MRKKVQKSTEGTQQSAQGIVKDPADPGLDRIARRTAKDSVFCDLFRDKRYLLQLYQALHPEDTETTEEDLTDITIRNVLTDGLYNDLGFRNRERVVILTEAQSTWSMNILVRGLMYLVQTWQRYLGETGANLYGSKKVHLPEPEFYVIFTGSGKNRPRMISLSDEFFKGKACSVEVTANVLYGGNGNDIVSQYVAFTGVYDNQIKRYGKTRRAVMETVRICKAQGVLKDYLEARGSEVVSIMMTLFDEESIMSNYVAQAAAKAAAEAAAKAAAEAEEKAAAKAAAEKERLIEAAAEKERRSARKLYLKGISVKDIAEASEVPESVVEQWLGLKK